MSGTLDRPPMGAATQKPARGTGKLQRYERPARFTGQRVRKPRAEVMAMTPKLCAHCAAAMTIKRWEGPAQYKKRKFCSWECQQSAALSGYKAARRSAAKPCVRCGAAIDARKPNQARKRAYCSTRCAYQHRIDQRPTCPLCGKQRKRTAKTCSLACGYVWRKSSTRTQRQCKECRKDFWPRHGKHVYCTRTCHLLGVGLRPRLIRLPCGHCGKVIGRYRYRTSRVKQSFCSRECSSKAMSGTGHPFWRGGSDPNRGSKWHKLAESIRKRDGYRCQRCNKTQKQEGKGLSVDHIIPWRLFKVEAEANDPKNLVSLCRVCHAIKTNTYERAYINGDVLGMEQYRKSIAMKPLSLLVEA